LARNDDITADEIRRRRPQAIVLSPGPCTPREAGICGALVRALGPTTPILGVCLGHQAIADALGGRIVRAPQPVHGRTSLIAHSGERLFAALPNPLRATRYHSLIAEESSLPDELRVTARCEDGLIMALEHRDWPVFGVQFHPESVLTECGHRLLANFLHLAGLQPRSLPVGDYAEAALPADDFYVREIGDAPLPLPS
jgi:anthranilate synthase/aminodeoxychorismate synthase-like glutamine amidotransferase